MAKRKKKKEAKKKLSFSVEIYSIIIILIGVLGICGYGPCGRLICAFFAFLCGTLYLVPLVGLIIIGVYLLFSKHYPDFFSSKVAGIILLIIGLLMVFHVSYVKDGITAKDIIHNTFNEVVNVFKIVDNSATREIAFKNTGGGMIGGLLLSLFYSLFALEGTRIIYWIFIIGGFLLFTGFSIVDFIKRSYDKSKELVPHHTKENEEHIIGIEPGDEVSVKINDSNVKKDLEDTGKLVINSLDDLKNKNKQVQEEVKEEVKEPVQIIDTVNYQLPKTDLLDKPKAVSTNNQGNIEKNINTLEEVLSEFGVIGKVVAVTVGPACTQYELAIKAGTKLSRLTSINKEISLALAKKDVRIQAPIPGKSTCGIEIANDEPTTVYVKEVMDSLVQNPENKKHILMGLGKDIKGNIQCYPIDKTPHMLVAGATGSGKSVCINCILASILMTKKPDEVKLLLVDPKKVELSMYNGVPHLLSPVVTDPKKASAALQKIVSEMEHRYDLFEEKHVKNIGTYNEWVDEQNEKRVDDKIPHMPYIVVVVDELADLMMVASKEVEDSIMRITQMARAAGIHLIIATQRPSTDVITGVIKANIPTRVSFAVSSGIDSRTILDMQGAEKLLGRGDMLFLPQGENSPTRIQGAWISEGEIKRIVDYVCEQQIAQYDQRFQNLEVTEGKPTTGVDANTEVKDEYDDPLYNDIVEFVVTTGKASASLLQRRFKLGYNRAARVIDLLEERGIIGPMNGSKPREVLVKLNNSNASSDYDDDEII